MSKPDIEKLIMDSQALLDHCDSSGTIELVMKCAEISKQRNELKTELESMKAENRRLQKLNSESVENYAAGFKISFFLITIFKEIFTYKLCFYHLCMIYGISIRIYRINDMIRYHMFN